MSPRKLLAWFDRATNERITEPTDSLEQAARDGDTVWELQPIMGWRGPLQLRAQAPGREYVSLNPGEQSQFHKAERRVQLAARRQFMAEALALAPSGENSGRARKRGKRRKKRSRR